MDELKRKSNASDTVTAAAEKAASANGLPAKPSRTAGGKTVISGNPTIVLNGEEVKGTGADIGDLASVTSGLGKLREKYNNGRFGKTEVKLNEETGNVMLNGGDTGLKAKLYAGGADDRTAAEGWARARELPVKPSRTAGGKTVISGNPTVVLNGEEVKGTGADIGDLASVTSGLSKLRDKYNNGRFGKPEVTLNEETGNVMLNGGDTGLKAKFYAGGADDRTAAEGWARATGNTLSQISTYAGLTDLGDIVKYNDDKITIGGIEVPYAYIDNNGRAYASKAAIDNAIAQVRRDTGIKNPVKLTADVMGSHERAIKNAVKNVVNRRSWSYDADNDPAYEAYAKQYTRNAEQMYNRAMGSGGLYGSPNSYQMYQALAAYGDNMQKLSDMVPQLAQQDYARYSDEQTRNRYALEALENERSADLSATVAANDNMYNRYRAADDLNYSRRRDALYNDPKEVQELRIGDNSVTQSNAYTARYPSILDLQIALQNGELTATGIANVKAMMENAVYRANMNGGVFSKQDMDALGIAQNLAKYPNSNGYPTVHAAEIQRLLDTWNIVEKPKALFSMGM